MTYDFLGTAEKKRNNRACQAGKAQAGGVMKRETREEIVRTALIAHYAKHAAMIMLPYAHEFIRRVCDAMDEQDARDAADTNPHPAEQHQAAMDAAAVSTEPTITDTEVIEYAARRANEIDSVVPFSPRATKWREATERYAVYNSPDEIIQLLRQDLAVQEAEATGHNERQISCEQSRRRYDAAKQADKIICLLWYIAAEFGIAELVWGDQLEARKAERDFNSVTV